MANNKKTIFASRRCRKREYIALKNQCDQKTSNLAVEWFTQQHTFNFGHALVMYPLKDGQFCITLKIQTSELDSKNKTNIAADHLLLSGTERTKFIDQIRCLIRNNQQESTIDILVNKFGLMATITVEQEALNHQIISEIIEQTHPAISTYLHKLHQGH